MKKTNLLGFLLVPSLLFIFSCKQGPGADAHVEVNIDSVRTQISGMEAAYADASNKRDAAAVASYYANDAESYPPGEPPAVGMDAIKSRIQREMDRDTSGTTLVLTSTGVWASGNYATETGTWEDKDKSGNTVAKGHFMTLFELRNGRYVAIRDIWNRETPAQMAMSTDTSTNKVNQ